MNEPVVWIAESEHWQRAELRALLIERGYDAIGFETLRDAVLRARLPGAVLPAAMVIDLTAQVANDALLSAVFDAGIPIVAVAGVVEAQDAGVRGRPWAAFLRRPITLGEIADAVARAAPARAARGS
jgi:hypothetical protein